MIQVYNNKILVDPEDKSYHEIRRVFKCRDESVKGVITYVDLYTRDDSFNLVLPRGYLPWIENRYEVSNSEVQTIDTSQLNAEDLSQLIKLSEKVTLRDDQLIALKKMIYLRRGIIQLATGSGKTEIMSAFLKCINHILGYYPTTLILEPSTLLVEATIERMNNYGIPALEYVDTRGGELQGVMVTHPASLSRDLAKNENLLNDVVILLCDEGHHLQASTWNRITKSSSKLEYSLCMSALVIEPDDLPKPDNILSLLKLSLEELLVIGGTGQVLINLPPKYYINKDILATPYLYRIYNSADEKVSLKSWAKIRKYVIESDRRSDLVSRVASYISSCNYKVLVLVGTKVVANRMLKIISEYTNESIVRCSFGGGIYYKYNTETDKVEKCKKDEDVKGQFDRGDCRVLIGTSHIYEGADIPNLDSVILVDIGRSSRKYIQGVGRCLRRTKTGRYAHIIDFTDAQNPILSYHSLLRRKMFTNLIGSSNIYDNISFEEFKKLFAMLELEVIDE